MMMTTINLSTSLGACVESDEDRLAISRVVGPGHCPDILSQARETGILQERGTFPVQASDGIDDRKRRHHEQRDRTLKRFSQVNDKPPGADWVIFESAERGGFRFRITF
jgi:hypothetical protein